MIGDCCTFKFLWCRSEWTENTDIKLSDRVQKKMENYTEIFGNFMRKKVTIMRKRRQIMQKFLKLKNYLLYPFNAQ